MIGDGTEYENPTTEESGELIDTIDTSDIYSEDDTGLTDQEDSFYATTPVVAEETEDNTDIVDDNIERINKAKELKNEAHDTLIALLSKALEDGEITLEMNAEIKAAEEQYTENSTIIKDTLGDVDTKDVQQQLIDLSDSAVKNLQDLMNLLNNNGRNKLIFADEDGRLYIEGEQIPKLTLIELDVQKLFADYAEITELVAKKATIEDLTATNATITNLKATIAEIQTLVGGNLTMDNIQSLVLTSDKVTIANALIKDAMIDTVSANKINTGTINTNNVSIQSEDGSLLINGTTQQFKDNTGKVRIQIGKDAQGNFTFALFSQDGVGILIDETGIKAGAVPDQIITNDMVADNANISGGKLDISSVISNINNNVNTINSSKIKFDETNQTLDVAFNQLKTKVETIENVTIDGDLSSVMEQVTTNTTNISVMQGQISSLISNTTITKQDGTVTQLKDEFNSVKDTVSSHTQTINAHESTLTSVSAKQAQLEQNLDGFKTTVSNTYTTKDELANTENHISTVEQTANKINWVVGSGTSQSNMTLTDEAYNLISNNVTITAEHINLDGYVSNSSDDPNWSIGTDGNMEVKNMNVEGELSTDVLNCNVINNPNYPPSLSGDINLYVNNVTGSDDYTLDQVLASIDESEAQGSADLIKKFYSLRGVHEALPKNLNGKTVRIYCETDDNGQVLFSQFVSGRILIFLCSHEIKGYLGDYNCYCDFKIYGGSSTSKPTTYGTIRPSTNTVYSSDNSSVFFQKSPACGIYYADVYGGASTSGYSALKVTEDCMCRIEECNFYSAYTFVNASSLAQVFCNKTTGMATDYAFKSYTGSTIHLANTSQANGKKGNAYWNNGSVIFGSLSQTIVGNYNITWDSSTPVENNTTTTATTTATVTYKCNYGDTYRSTVYNNWKKDNTCRQGDYGYGDCTGVWFFGTQFAELKGKTITKVTITISRQSGGSSSSVEHKLWMHNYATRPSGAPTLTSGWSQTFNLAVGNSTTITITNSTVLNAIKNGTCKGFAIRHTYDSSHYSVCSGSATVKITYNE